MQRSQARSLTLFAQVSTMGLVALVALVAVAGVPGLAAPASGVPAMPEPMALDQRHDGDGAAAMGQRIEIDPIIDSLKRLPNAPEVVQGESGSTAGTSIGGVGQNEPSLVAFLGAVIATNHRAAMLKAGDDKAWVGEGQTRDLGGRTVRVLEVHSDHVRLAIDGSERRLDRGERTGSAVARVVRTEDLGDGNAMDFGGRRRGLEDARNEMLRAPNLDPLRARRNSANAMLQRATDMEETNPAGAERLRKRAEQLLSVNPSIAGTTADQDPER